MKTYSRKKSGETQDVILDLNELCRLCMAKEDELVPIFNNDEPIPLTLRIMACVALEVFEGDGLPNKICHPCKFQLEKSYNFRKKCENSDMKLRQHLKSLQAKIGDVDLNITEENESTTSDSVTNTVKQTEETEAEPSTEEDLVGVAQVAYIQPDPDPEDDPESITLPPETELINKDACTLKSLKREVMDVEEQENEGIIFVDEGSQEVEDTSYDAIADAVKATLATQPEIEDNLEISLEVLDESCAASVYLLPERTKVRYQKEYEDFKEWLKSMNVSKYTEDVLLAYVKKKSEVYSPTSLWSKISMLKLALKVYDNIDISRFGKLFLFLRRNSDGYRPKKSKILSEEEVTKFLLEADDYTWLLEKVVLMCGIFGACTRDELIKLTVDDFESTNRNILVVLRYTKNKKRRVFVIPKEGLPFNAYSLYKKYADLRPPDLETRRFFIGYKNGKCVKQVVGIHTIGGVPKKIATFLKLENPELYTGHSFRRSSATMLAENGGDPLYGKELVGWDPSAVAETSGSKRMKITK